MASVTRLLRNSPAGRYNGFGSVGPSDNLPLGTENPAMRQGLLLEALVSLGLLVVPPSLVLAGKPAQDQTEAIAVPGEIGPAVLDGHDLYVLAGGKELLRVDLATHKVAPVVRFPEGQAPQLLGVSGSRACVAARDGKGDTHLHVIDLAGGQIVRTIDQAPPASGGIGFVAGDLLYVVDGQGVKIVEIATGRPRHVVAVKGGVLMGCHQVGDRLYVAREYAGGLAVIDLKEGKLLDLIETRDWLFQVQVVGDGAFVWGSFKGLGRIDLETRQYQALQQPEPDNANHHYAILAGPGKRLLVLGQKAVYEYDARGRRIGGTPLPAAAPRTLAGVWNGRAVLVGKDTVSLVELGKTTKPR